MFCGEETTVTGRFLTKFLVPSSMLMEAIDKPCRPSDYRTLAKPKRDVADRREEPLLADTDLLTLDFPSVVQISRRNPLETHLQLKVVQAMKQFDIDPAKKDTIRDDIAQS